ncbi:MAG: hypothetical protein V1685_03075 [Parcubacteria group bacterium]
MPTTKLGKWSAGLNIVFLVVVIIAVLLTQAFKLLNFGDRWWDITVAILVPVELIAFITGIIAMRKKDRSGLVVLSVVTGACAILFALLHSLFISD